MVKVLWLLDRPCQTSNDSGYQVAILIFGCFCIGAQVNLDGPAHQQTQEPGGKLNHSFLPSLFTSSFCLSLLCPFCSKITYCTLFVLQKTYYRLFDNAKLEARVGL